MRLIDADKLLEDLKKTDRYFMLKFDIENAPTVCGNNPKWCENCVSKGKWIEENSETGALGIKYTWFKCNQCGWKNSLVIPRNYCPNCGAKMDGGEEE